jgi:hypothetical protein
VFPDFNYQWLVDEIKHNLPLELNFAHEAQNAARCRKNLNSPRSTVAKRCAGRCCDWRGRWLGLSASVALLVSLQGYWWSQAWMLCSNGTASAACLVACLAVWVTGDAALTKPLCCAVLHRAVLCCCLQCACAARV